MPTCWPYGPGPRGTARDGSAERDLRLSGARCRAGVFVVPAQPDDRSLMNLAIAATCFGVIFVAELPDKTALASLVLGTRYRAAFVFAGVAAAFTVHVVLAVSAGSLLLLLPHRILEAVVAVLFAAGAALMLRRRDDELPAADAEDTTGGEGPE